MLIGATLLWFFIFLWFNYLVYLILIRDLLETHNDLYDVGVKNNLFSMIAKLDEKCSVNPMWQNRKVWTWETGSDRICIWTYQVLYTDRYFGKRFPDPELLSMLRWSWKKIRLSKTNAIKFILENRRMERVVEQIWKFTKMIWRRKALDLI